MTFPTLVLVKVQKLSDNVYPYSVYNIFLFDAFTLSSRRWVNMRTFDICMEVTI